MHLHNSMHCKDYWTCQICNFLYQSKTRFLFLEASTKIGKSLECKIKFCIPLDRKIVFAIAIICHLNIENSPMYCRMFDLFWSRTWIRKHSVLMYSQKIQKYQVSSYHGLKYKLSTRSYWPQSTTSTWARRNRRWSGPRWPRAGDRRTSGWRGQRTQAERSQPLLL